MDRLEDVMAAADVVVLAVPASPQTHHLIDAAALGAMTPDSYLINIARGDVVDEAALITALQKGRIAVAGLDVYEFEPKVPEALCAMENVTLLPQSWDLCARGARRDGHDGGGEPCGLL